MTHNASHYESVGSHAWSATDERFFRITTDLFDPAYLRGATVLLASYDDSVAFTPFPPTRGAPQPEPAHRTAAPAA